MATRTYAALLEAAPAGGFGVSFPDLPGCVSFGETMDEAVRNAHEALALHLEGMVEDGDTLPDATMMNALATAGTNAGAWALVTVEEPDTADRVNVYLPRTLLQRVDAYVRDHAPMNRSTFFSEAARLMLGQRRGLAAAGAQWHIVGVGGLAGAVQGSGPAIIGNGHLFTGHDIITAVQQLQAGESHASALYVFDDHEPGKDDDPIEPVRVRS